jgi:hypothetical protein
MVKFQTVGMTYGALRKECLEAIRQWPGCETVSGIQIIRDNSPAGFSVRVTLYGEAHEKIADRAIIYVQRPGDQGRGLKIAKPRHPLDCERFNSGRPDAGSVALFWPLGAHLSPAPRDPPVIVA